jgi:2-phospho-L-lactate guanylyltransferase
MTGSASTSVLRKEPARSGWVAVVPVKDPVRGKSRLGGGRGVGDADGGGGGGRVGGGGRGVGDAGGGGGGASELERAQLAQAFAKDVLAALKAAPSVSRVVVITDSHETLRLAEALGCESLKDPTSELNDAIKFAASSIGGDDPICVWVSDLPCLQPNDVETVLAQAASAFAADATQSFVPDDNSGGTTALLARAPRYLTPHFGPNSAKAHEAAGAKPLTGTPRSRLDVDTQADLTRAIALGVGPATQQKKN